MCEAVALRQHLGHDDGVQIPWTSLKPETLRAIVEEFITREGTDYGDVEVSLQHKVDAVVVQLKNGHAAVFWDEDTETCTLQAVEPGRRRRDAP